MSEIMGIGNLKSDKKGDAARANSGKDRLDLIPVSVLRSMWHTELLRDMDLQIVLEGLDCWERRDNHAYAMLIGALKAVDPTGAEAAAVLDFGAKKYAAWNWTKGMSWMSVKASLMRHVRALVRNEGVNDPDSGLPHKGHIACNLIFLLYYWTNYPEGDDRPPIWRDK